MNALATGTTVHRKKSALTLRVPSSVFAVLDTVESAIATVPVSNRVDDDVIIQQHIDT